MESSVDGGLGSYQIEIQGEHFSQRDLEVNKQTACVSAESRNVPIRLKHEAPGANVRNKSENSANHGSP